MVKLLEGFTPYKKEDAEKYTSCRWWSGLTFGDILDRAADIPCGKTLRKNFRQLNKPKRRKG